MFAMRVRPDAELRAKSLAPVARDAADTSEFRSPRAHARAFAGGRSTELIHRNVGCRPARKVGRRTFAARAEC